MLYLITLFLISIIFAAEESQASKVASLKKITFQTIQKNPGECLPGSKAVAMLHHLNLGTFDHLLPDNYLLQAPITHAVAKKQLNRSEGYLFFPKFAGDFLMDDRKFQFSGWGSILKVTTAREIFIHNIRTNKTTVLKTVIRDLSNSYDISNKYCAYLSKYKNLMTLHIRDLEKDQEITNPISSKYGMLKFINNGLLCRYYNNVIELYNSNAELILKKAPQFAQKTEVLYEVNSLEDNDLFLKTHAPLSLDTTKDDYKNWHYYIYNYKMNTIKSVLLPSEFNKFNKRICALSPDKKTALWHLYDSVESELIIQNLYDGTINQEIFCDDSGPVLAQYINNSKVAIIQYFYLTMANRHRHAYCLNLNDLSKIKLSISETAKVNELRYHSPATFDHYGNLEIITLRKHAKQDFINQINENRFLELNHLNAFLAKGHARRYFTEDFKLKKIH